MITPDDLALVHGRAFTDYPRAWSAAEIAEFLEMDGCFLVGDLRAFVIGRVVLDEAEVLTVATDPDFRRQGLARAALQEFADRARGMGAVSAFLEVAEDNIAARPLYLAAGFVEVGRRPRYYHASDGKTVAAILMRKDL